MRLAFLIYRYFPFGGQQRDFLRVLKACQAKGFSITIYTMKWEGDRPKGVEITVVPVKAWRNHTRYQKFSDWVNNKLKSEQYDGVIGFNKMPGLDVYFAADPCFAERALSQRSSFYRFTARYRHFIKFERAVFSGDSKTQVMILSPSQRQDFGKHYPESIPRLHDIPPGISLDRKAPENVPALKQQYREELGFSKSDLLVLQIGSAGFQIKGVDRSLRAIASLPDELLERSHFILLGQDKQAPFKRQAKKLGIWNRCHFLGARDDVPKFLFAADILLHPAYSESAGYVLLEATVAGLPVLTTDTCGYAFHIENAHSGIVCRSPFDQNVLNKHLESMLRGEDCQTFSDNGIRYGEEQDLYLMPERVADIISGLLEATPSATAGVQS
ncbi:MAG: glycosyltransferase family 4 protein [Pseudohongiellaceae bacterium]|nr:glycosyltransferase family 4 protein [Pseudohongiellaceae bacterium]